MSKKKEFPINPALLQGCGARKYAKTPRNNFPGMERRLSYGYKEKELYEEESYDYRDKAKKHRRKQK